MRRFWLTIGALCVFAQFASAQQKICRDILDVASDPDQASRRVFVLEFEPAIRAMLQKYTLEMVEARLHNSKIFRVHFVPDLIVRPYVPAWLKSFRIQAVQPLEKDYVILLHKGGRLDFDSIMLFDPATKQKVGRLPSGKYIFADGRTLYAWWSYPDGHQYKWLPQREAWQNLVEKL